MGFLDYITPLISSSFNWLTFLTISNITCSRGDIVKLSELVNLGVLTVDRGVRCPEFGLEDGIVRAWERAANESDAFRMLRVLNFRGQRDISDRVFLYLQGFPALALFILEDCDIGVKDVDTAAGAGWKCKTEHNLTDFLPEPGCVNNNWNSVTHAAFRAAGIINTERMIAGSKSLHRDISTADRAEAVDLLPVLHFSFAGAPRDADLDRNCKLQCFERTTARSNMSEKHDTGLKRPLGGCSPRPRCSRKKPVIRASKQLDVNSWFTGLTQPQS
ncbi:MAG: hypothetical protein Q9191_005859 [Dirinaria sp. TL-2023a]